MSKITLKAARVNSGLTQAEAAKEMGVSTVTLGLWEKNPEKIKWQNIRKLIYFLI